MQELAEGWVAHFEEQAEFAVVFGKGDAPKEGYSSWHDEHNRPVRFNYQTKRWVLEKTPITTLKETKTKESANFVKTLSSTSETDAKFTSGKNAVQAVSEHYSSPSKYEGRLDQISSGKNRKIREAIYAVIVSDTEEDLSTPIKTPKGQTSAKEVLQGLGVDTNSKETVQRVRRALRDLDDNLTSTGAWKIPVSDDQPQALPIFSAGHIMLRSDLKEASNELVRTKAFSIGSMNQDSLDSSKLSPHEVDAIFSLLPAAARSSLGSTDPANKAQRGRLALYMWFAQGGRDGYTLVGERKSPGAFEVEHITPLAKGGTNDPDNLLLLTKNVNRGRGNRSLSELFNFAKRRIETYKKKANDPVFQKKLRDGYKSSAIHRSINTNNGPFSKTLESFFDPAVYKKIQAAYHSSVPKDERVSRAKFAEFSSKIKSIAPPTTKISELSENQLGRLFDALEYLGGDKKRLRAYAGRGLLNNADLGYHRLKISSSGVITRSRQGGKGTEKTPVPLLRLQNRLLGKPESISQEEYSATLAHVSELQSELRDTWNRFLDKTSQPSTSDFHEKLGNLLEFVSGSASTSPQWVKDRRAEEKDIVRTIEEMLKKVPPSRPIEGPLKDLYKKAANYYYKVDSNTARFSESALSKNQRDKLARISKTLRLIEGVDE